MKAPSMIGVVERRLLVNYRTDPQVTARLLPAPLRPQRFPTGTAILDGALPMRNVPVTWNALSPMAIDADALPVAVGAMRLLVPAESVGPLA